MVKKTSIQNTELNQTNITQELIAIYKEFTTSLKERINEQIYSTLLSTIMSKQSALY